MFIWKMHIPYLLTMASAILFTAFLIYLHTYACFGQQSNFFNHNNFGKKHCGTAGAQSSPNTHFTKNLTGNASCGNGASSQQGSPLLRTSQLDSQNPMNPQPEQAYNLQQAMALQQINMQALANLQQPINMPQASPAAAAGLYNIPTNMKPSLSLPEPMQEYNMPPLPMNTLQLQQSYQFPTQSAIPMQYSLQIPQAIPPYSVTSNYGIPTQSCPTPISVPVSIMETSQMYNSAPSFIPYSISQPSVSSIFPNFDPNQSIMMGQNDVLLNPQDPAYFSILQTPSNLPQYRVLPSYPMNTVIAPDVNQNSKASSLKALLPIIIDLLKDRSSCPCHSGCNCDKKKRTTKPHVSSSYSKQKKYPLSDDGPAIEASGESETIRNIREPKKAGKLKNKIPDESAESHAESSEYSEDDDNEEE